MKKENIIFACIVGVLVFYIGNRTGEIYNASAAADALSKISEINDSIHLLYEDIYISKNTQDLFWGLIAAVCWGFAAILMAVSRHNYMAGIEHGSAKWGTPSDIGKMVDKKYDNNMLMTQSERISINTRLTMRNNNVLVVGGSGSGKTRFYAKPNLMQMHSSYVITDPKGQVIVECGKMLADNGYEIKSLNLVDFAKSMHYNPFRYLKNEQDILTLTDMIIKNCGDKSEKQDFWVKAERLLYQALIGYVFYELPEEVQNFSTVLRLLNQMEVREEDESFINVVDKIFLELELGTEAFYEQHIREEGDGSAKEVLQPEDIKPPNPNHYAVLQYKKYKMAAGKTAKSILISCGVRLSPFDIKAVRELTEFDEMALDTIGDKKTALFIIIDDTSSTFNFLASMLYSQLFNTLCHKADNEYGGRLPVHVRCLLDEFANIGQIPDFEKLIATIRSREISASVIVQNMAQIKGLYDKQAGTIVGNCDTMLFLGSGEDETMKSISEKVGKTTVDHKGTSTQKGMQGSFTMSDQIIARELITPAEVGLLPNDQCILFIRGINPFKSKKFKIEAHSRYKQLSDYKKKNAFDITEYNKKLEQEGSSDLDILFDDDNEELIVVV